MPATQIDLVEARLTVRDSVLHIGTSTFDDDKVDRAILAAGRRFVSETNCTTERNPFTIPAAAGLLDLSTSLITDFIRDQYMSMILVDSGFDFKAPSPYRSLIRRNKGGDSFTGQPKFFAFPSDSEIYFFPRADTTYAAEMLRRTPFVDFVPGIGTPSSVSLNIPLEWVYRVLFTGCKYYLIGGAPGHPDATEAMRQFEALIAEAKQHFIDGRPGIMDRQTHPGMAASARPERTARGT